MWICCCMWHVCTPLKQWRLLWSQKPVVVRLILWVDDVIHSKTCASPSAAEHLMLIALTAVPLTAAALTNAAALPATPTTSVPLVNTGRLLHLPHHKKALTGEHLKVSHHQHDGCPGGRHRWVCGWHSKLDFIHLIHLIHLNHLIHLILFAGRWRLGPAAGIHLRTCHASCLTRHLCTGKDTILSCKVPMRNEQRQHFPQVAAEHKKNQVQLKFLLKTKWIRVRFQDPPTSTDVIFSINPPTSPDFLEPFHILSFTPPQKDEDVAGRDTSARLRRRNSSPPGTLITSWPGAWSRCSMGSWHISSLWQGCTNLSPASVWITWPSAWSSRCTMGSTRGRDGVPGTTSWGARVNAAGHITVRLCQPSEFHNFLVTLWNIRGFAGHPILKPFPDV